MTDSNESEEGTVVLADNGTTTDDAVTKDTDISKEEPTTPVTPPRDDDKEAADPPGISATNEAIITNTPKTRNLPQRNLTSDSIKSGPLPTIEECLFGIPRDITNKSEDEDEIAKFFVPLSLLRRVASQGIDDDDEKQSGCHRGLAWRIRIFAARSTRMDGNC
jgi:hypothetical protein